MVYPDGVLSRIIHLKHIGPLGVSSAEGKEVNFACGSFVRFSLVIDAGVVTSVVFSSNGCGFMLAAADIMADQVTGKQLTELHGLSGDDLLGHVVGQIGEITTGRLDCVDACISALRRAFAEYRSSQIEEFRGEKALLCTCFSVTEETVEMVLNDTAVETVEDVTRLCRAGGGCGSCTMMIQEMLDNRLAVPKTMRRL